MSPACPRCGHVREPECAAPPGECPACGVIYERFLARRAREDAAPPLIVEVAPPLRLRAWDALWTLPERDDPVAFWGRCAVLALIVVWGVWFMRQPWTDGASGESFLHSCDLPFHEFGHVLFRPFGEWLMFLGGSLFQCLLPLLLAGWFIVREQQPFSAAVCMWWAGQNFIDVAPYIGDARALSLQLVGEATEEIARMREFRHDWHNILAPLGWLEYDHRLASAAKAVGVLLMLASWLWAGGLLWQQWTRRR